MLIAKMAVALQVHMVAPEKNSIPVPTVVYVTTLKPYFVSNVLMVSAWFKSDAPPEVEDYYPDMSIERCITLLDRDSGEDPEFTTKMIKSLRYKLTGYSK